MKTAKEHLQEQKKEAYASLQSAKAQLAETVANADSANGYTAINNAREQVRNAQNKYDTICAQLG